MGLVLGRAGDERLNLRDVVLSRGHAFHDAPSSAAAPSFVVAGS
jgi:hypothetical protein